MSEWFASHSDLLWWTAALSGIAFVATLAIIPALAIRMPSDYFASSKRRESPWARRHPVLRGLLLIARNLLAAVLAIAGLAMLVLPGQGLLTLLLAVVVMDLPGKYALERWLVTRPPVFAAISRLRARAARAPLDLGPPGNAG